MDCETDVPISKVCCICVNQSGGPNDGPTFRFKTAVYNKRDEPVYEGMPMVIYPEADTMLSKQCKYGIVY